MLNKTKNILDRIREDVTTNRIVLFMKGNKEMPQCGFSAQVTHILLTHGVEYVSRNVLENDALRQAIKEFSDWPTIPQLYVDGTFIGGCDIITQLHESGELKTLLEA